MQQPDEHLARVTVELVGPLLESLDALNHIARHLNPQRLSASIAAWDDRDVRLRAAREGFLDAVWPVAMVPFRDQIDVAVLALLRAGDGLRTAATEGDLRQAYRALRQVPRACEALYPLTAALPSVSRHFLAPALRDDAALLERLVAGALRPDIRNGVLHAANAISERGGFSVYVPEDYDPARAYPLVMALHGGAGHGRLFLWSWVREARSRGVIVVAPTATGDTWPLHDPDVDEAHLFEVLAAVTRDWRIDPTHRLLTGMSDGGTFTLLAGIGAASPFTHLAPVAASFHPLLLTMADPDRLRGLPVYLVHGVLDWVFPVAVARSAYAALQAAGAAVVYRERADLSHTYPRDENDAMLDWFLE